MASEGSPQMSSGTSLKWSIFSWQKVVAGGTFVGRMGWRAPALMLCVRGALGSAGLLGGISRARNCLAFGPPGRGLQGSPGGCSASGRDPLLCGGSGCLRCGCRRAPCGSSSARLGDVRDAVSRATLIQPHLESVTRDLRLPSEGPAPGRSCQPQPWGLGCRSCLLGGEVAELLETGAATPAFPSLFETAEEQSQCGRTPPAPGSWETPAPFARGPSLAAAECLCTPLQVQFPVPGLSALTCIRILLHPLLSGRAAGGI